MIQSIFFILITAFIASKAISKYKSIYRNINLGKDEQIIASPNRLRNMIYFALGQKKMFDRPIVGIFHLFIYTAFIITQIELIEVFVDGISGNHRIFASLLGGFYTLIINSIEVLSLLALVATFIFLYRRNILKLIRFQKPEMKGWPTMDANIILLGEITLVIGIFLMNSSDQVLQKIDPSHYIQTGRFYLSSLISENMLSNFPKDWLVLFERFGWWLHYLTVLGFVLYLPYSKHLHIFLAFPNAYFSRISPRGEMGAMPAIENEVRGMIGLEIKNPDVIAPTNFGAKDIFDLSWRNLMEAYSCTECGRCTSVCPANLSGKKLSPRKIMMDIRDRMEEVGTKLDKLNSQAKEFDDGKNLFDLISREEIYACTTCNACVQACPVLINPLEPILEMRRYDILMNSAGPSEWLPMFNSLENSQSAWSISSSRTEWAKD
ncbi:MAG TPA: (Fe-S)-binding protein [Saprospiraceae bacterium]|nr:(Fe-S)-binding protein [Saprospiraceae bacterium]